MPTTKKREPVNGTAFRAPPSDERAEIAVLGCCMLLESALDDVMEILQPEHFYADANAKIYRVLLEMRSAGKCGIDALTVAAALEKRGWLADVGGPVRLSEILDAVPHAAFAKDYAKTILEHSRRRSAISAGTSLARGAWDLTAETDELLIDAETAIHRAMESGLVDEPESIGDVLLRAVDEIQSGKPKPKSVPTDWTELDDKTNGFPLGGVVILAARPSAGKTACALSLAGRIAEAGTPTLFVSYEQTRVELAQRLLSIFSAIDHWKLAKSRLTDDENHQVLLTAGQIQTLPLTLDDSCRPQSSLMSLIRRHSRRKKTKLVIVDYLQLIEPDDKRLPREQQVSGISRQLKRTAMACNVAILCLSQLNRDVEKRESKRPRLSDLRESGALEQDADQVWLLHRPNDGVPTEIDDYAILEVAKNRNGPKGDVKLNWHPTLMKYSKEFVIPFQ